MSNTQSSDRPPTPMHLWIIGVVALLWNAMGALDFTMTLTRNEEYLAQFTPEQLEFSMNFPSWMIGIWAVAVWGSVLGSVLLLLRNALASPVFLASLAAMTAFSIRNFCFANGMEIMDGVVPLIFTIVIFVSSIALFRYARAMAMRGVLR